MENKPIVLKTISTSINNMKIKDMNFNMLTLMTGANGSGKTVLMILYWSLNLIANLFFMSKKNLSACRTTFQYILDNSYSNQDFTGDIEADFGDFKLICSLDNGKIKDFDIILNDPNFDTTTLSLPNYMSSSTRLFSNILQYINFRDALEITDTLQIGDEKQMNKLLKSYKLYDILFLEKSLTKLSNPFFELGDSARKSIKELTSKEIIGVFYDKKKSDILYTEIKDGNKETKSVSLLSAGEQALLNMLSQY